VISVFAGCLANHDRAHSRELLVLHPWSHNNRSFILKTGDVNTMSAQTNAHILMLVFLLHVAAFEVASIVAEAT
jgi:hypothetical protein